MSDTNCNDNYKTMSEHVLLTHKMPFQRQVDPPINSEGGDETYKQLYNSDEIIIWRKHITARDVVVEGRLTPYTLLLKIITSCSTRAFSALASSSNYTKHRQNTIYHIQYLHPFLIAQCTARKIITTILIHIIYCLFVCLQGYGFLRQK